ncbi:hypothetical protein [Paenibacillus dendrobii]|nr:hypothetical protein [Paenibacillus dendrobii]
MMRKIRFRDERGSALVMVLFMVLLLTILGTAVVAAAIGGAQRTQTRENDVQSLHLAEKSLDEGVSYISSAFQGRSIDPENMDGIIQEFVMQMRGKAEDGGLTLGSELGTDGQDQVSGKITLINYDSAQRKKTEYPITLQSEAVVNGVKRKLSRQIVIDTYPDFLKYALGSEGNLILNGSSQIQGNIYAGNLLQLSNTANYIHGSDYTASTLFPSLDGEAHVQSLKSVACADQLMSKPPFQAEGCKSPLGDGFMLDQLLIKPHAKFVSIDVQDSFVDKLSEAAGVSRETLQQQFGNGASNIIKGLQESEGSLGMLKLTMPEPPGEPPIEPGADADEASKQTYETLKDQYEQAKIDYSDGIIKLNQELAAMKQSVLFHGNLTVDGENIRSLTYENKGNGNGSYWLIVDGDLTIDAHSLSKNINILANILVTGNVFIQGDIRFDSTLFTLKSTTVQDANIRGLNGKELVLISAGKILVNRVDAFNNSGASEQNELKAFFYTDSTADLYGVGSTFQIKGGFFAKGDLTVNAMLGNVNRPSSSTNPLIFEPQSGVGQYHRFRVIYNKEIYNNQNLGLPKVNRVNVRVGPLKLE